MIASDWNDSNQKYRQSALGRSFAQLLRHLRCNLLRCDCCRDKHSKSAAGGGYFKAIQGESRNPKSGGGFSMRQLGVWCLLITLLVLLGLSRVDGASKDEAIARLEKLSSDSETLRKSLSEELESSAQLAGRLQQSLDATVADGVQMQQRAADLTNSIKSLQDSSRTLTEQLQQTNEELTHENLALLDAVSTCHAQLNGTTELKFDLSSFLRQNLGTIADRVAQQESTIQQLQLAKSSQPADPQSQQQQQAPASDNDGLRVLDVNVDGSATATASSTGVGDSARSLANLLNHMMMAADQLHQELEKDKELIHQAEQQHALVTPDAHGIAHEIASLADRARQEQIAAVDSLRAQHQQEQRQHEQGQQQHQTPPHPTPAVVHPPTVGLDQMLPLHKQTGIESQSQVNAHIKAAPFPHQFRPPQHNGSPEAERLEVQRQEIKTEFMHAWEGYRAFAWGFDELHPISRSGRNSQYYMALTMIDALDTIILMGLENEYRSIRAYLSEFLVFNQQEDINLFETTIRVMGGLLSAFALTGDELFKSKAKEIADGLLIAFDTPTGLPKGTVGLRTKTATNPGWSGGASTTAEVGSLHLEWQYLSRVTGVAVYETKVDRITDAIEKLQRNLYPLFLNVDSGHTVGSTVTFGARVDSIYEYFLKQYVLSGGEKTKPLELYKNSMREMKEKLLREVPVDQDAKTADGTHDPLLFLAESTDGTLKGKMDHLVCFVPGMLALGAWTGSVTGTDAVEHMSWAKRIIRTCMEFYHMTPTGLSPEIIQFTLDPNPGHGKERLWVDPHAQHSLLRPETVESLFVLWRTTHDPIYREWGWSIFESLRAYARVEGPNGGYSGLKDVRDNTKPTDLLQMPGKTWANWNDKMESFFLSETMKYLYLLFSPDDVLPLDEWVFNTEAHPLPIAGGKLKRTPEAAQEPHSDYARQLLEYKIKVEWAEQQRKRESDWKTVQDAENLRHEQHREELIRIQKEAEASIKAHQLRLQHEAEQKLIEEMQEAERLRQQLDQLQQQQQSQQAEHQPQPPPQEQHSQQQQQQDQQQQQQQEQQQQEQQQQPVPEAAAPAEQPPAAAASSSSPELHSSPAAASFSEAGHHIIAAPTTEEHVLEHHDHMIEREERESQQEHVQHLDITSAQQPASS